jgi:hypothetical protein
MLEYVIGMCMAAISNRVYPIRSIRPRNAFERVKNLVWDRWGERKEERIQSGYMESNTSANSSRQSSTNPTSRA